MAFLLLVLMAGIGAAVTARAARHLTTAAILRRTNYRGLTVPTAAGVTIVLALMVAGGVLGVIRSVADSTPLASKASQAVWFLALTGAFGLLGLWDDIAGRDDERGWGAHLGALRYGRATSGAMKLAGGSAVALAAVAARGDTLGWTVVGSAVVALSANLMNMFDRRPGRCIKFFLVGALPLVAVGGARAPMLAAMVGAAAAFLPLDLRERAMLGDAGANALGAALGWAIVDSANHGGLVIVLVVLVLLTALGERPGLSRLIDATPPLRMFDRLGRVPE